MRGVFSSLYFLIPILLIIAPMAAKAESLEEAWQAALQKNKRLQASRLSMEYSEEGLMASKAERLPKLTAESGYTVLDNAPAAVVDSPLIPSRELPSGEDKSLSYKVMATIPLFTSGRIKGAVDAADAGLRASRKDNARDVLDLKMDVAEAYVAALRAERDAQVMESSIKSLSSHLRDIEGLFGQGLVARNDLLAASVALADARQRALQAQNAVDVARASYNRLLGRPLDYSVKLDDLKTGENPKELDELIRRALKERPEIGTLWEQAESLRHEAMSIKASVYPQFFLSGGYSFQENRFQAHEGVWSAMLSLRWEVFDGGVARHRAGARRRKAEALLSLREDESSFVELDVRRAWLSAGEALKRIEVTGEAVAQAEENLKVARDRYQNGIGTNTEVLDAEALRIRSLGNNHNAVYDAVLSALRLRRAVGDL